MRWAITFKRSISPETGERYIFAFLGVHLFEIAVHDEKKSWFQRLPFYLVFWPFKIVHFNYRWVDDMTYAEYLKKEEELKGEKYCDITPLWQPDDIADELDADGHPKNKTVRILVARKERKRSLKDVEAYSIAAEFETKDNYRGNRIITLFLEINNISTVISKVHDWQEAAATVLQNAFNAWSKTVTYDELRLTTMEKMKLAMGSTDGSFIDELNEDVKIFGFSVINAQAGNIFINKETRNLIDSQEKKTIAKNDFDAAEINAKTTETNAKAKALAIETVGTAEANVLDKKATVVKSLVKDTNEYAIQQIKAKYGDAGIAGLRGVHVEQGTSSASPINTGNLIDHFISGKMLEVHEQEGGQV